MTTSRNDYGIPHPSEEMETASHEHPSVQDLEDVEAEASSEVALFLANE